MTQIKLIRAALCYAYDMEDREHLPGERAAETGHYAELNVFGTPTGTTTHAQQGERLPVAPRGFTWRRIEAVQRWIGGA